MMSQASQAIDEYKQELVKRLSSAKHLKETIRLLRKLAEDCKYQTISDIDAGSLDTFLSGVIRRGLSARTHNAYLKAIGALCRWLLGYQRIERDPTMPIRSMDVRKDKRQAWLVAGGVGLPPMLWLAEALCAAGRETIAFCGAQTRDLLALSWDDDSPPAEDAPTGATTSDSRGTRSPTVMALTSTPSCPRPDARATG